MPTKRLKKTFFCLQLFVVPASAALSGFCGWLAASLLYGGIHWQGPTFKEIQDLSIIGSGIIFGTLAGIGAGLLWSWAMRRSTFKKLTKTGRVSSSVIASGIVNGFLVGIAATIFLHLALTILTGKWSNLGENTLSGLFLGVPSGLGLGLICGFVWWAVCRTAVRNPSEFVEVPPQ